MKHVNIVQTAEFSWLPWQPKGYIYEKIKKKFISSEAIGGKKLNLCRNVHNISLYKNYVFHCCCSCAFVAMTT